MPKGLALSGTATHTPMLPPALRAAAWRAVGRRRWCGVRLPARTCSLTTRAQHQEETDPRLVLGIESSCDDTGVAVVTASGRVLGQSLATQTQIHAPWGGVVPKLAQEAHEAAINDCVEAALAEAGVTPDQLAAVAVTIGPGLSLCLWVGVSKARQLAAQYQLPLVSVHHMEAHALVARLGAPSQQQQQEQQQQHVQQAGAEAEQAAVAAEAAEAAPAVQFPFLCLLVSGGHNLLVVVEGVGQYLQLGTTLDDALGEAYDKVARLLGLELVPSGGAALEAFAREGDPHAVPLSVPMQRRPNCDFSFAGLKTAVRLAIEARVGEGAPPTEENRQVRADIAASFQRVAVKHLEERVRRAVGWARETHPSIRQLVVAGGVACNQTVRARLAAVAEAAGLQLVCPPPRLCTDNGVMVAWAGVERLRLGHSEPPPPPPPPSTAGTGALEAGSGSGSSDREWIDLRPRWPLTNRRDPRSYIAPRSAKKKNIFVSLEQLAAQQAQQEAGQQQQPQPEGVQQQQVAAGLGAGEPAAEATPEAAAL